MPTSKVNTMFFVCLILGLISGYAWAAFVVYQPQITKLQADLSATRTELSILEVNYNSLNSKYNQLSSNHSKLSSDYLNLNLSYSKLHSDYSSLNIKYADLTSYYKSLSENVTELYELLYSYSLIPDAFSRTLNDVEVQKTSSAVLSATGGSTDHWSSYQKIYNYIVSNIEYAEDISMPYPSTYWHVNFDGFEYITEFTIITYNNYVQTPGLTLELEQGDCDDQAVLAYAMMKYYMKYIVGTEYDLYIIHVEFSDGSAHLAVILPVQGDQLCIIDPAGKYLTSKWGVIASKQALSELQAYSNYWSPRGHITYMEVYRVNIIDGSYSLAAKGTLDQVVAIFK